MVLSTLVGSVAKSLRLACSGRESLIAVALLSGVMPVMSSPSVGADYTVDQTPMPVSVEKAFDHFQVERPVLIDHAGDGSGRLFIGSQLGTIYVLPSVASKDEPTAFLEIEPLVSYKEKQNEEGLLGLAFHPKYKTNGQFFVYYTTTVEPNTSYVSRFKVSPSDPNVADPKSEEILMKVKQPFWNHNGGTIAFGPDGFLYIALGDGGNARDPLLSAQDTSTVLGKILRIDVDKKDPGLAYAIPRDNPYATLEGARPEIYATGLRNVWRMSFDRESGQLYIADVGQDLWEEINLGKLGGNYGWSVREATHPFAESASNSSPLIEPIWEYPHNADWGKSITGGNVYRGKQIDALKGFYLYGDYVTGKLWALKVDPETKQTVANRPIAWPSALPIVTFGEDESGEVYFTSTASGGIIYRFADIKD